MENSLKYVNSATILNFPESLKETKISSMDVEQTDMVASRTQRINTQYTEPDADEDIVIWVQWTITYNASDFITKIEKSYMGMGDPGLA